MRNFWETIKAFFRWDLDAVCRQSTGKADYHDYPDGTIDTPMHFYTYTCKRCGKAFEI